MFCRCWYFRCCCKKNTELNKAYQQAYKEFGIYTIPSSEMRLDVLNQERVRIQSLVNNVTQKLLTFTPKNLKNLQKEVKVFFTPNMLIAFNDKLSEDKEGSTRRGKLYQVFLPSGVADIKTTDKLSSNGKKVRIVNVNGQLKKFNADNEKEVFTVQGMQINIEVEEVAVSKSNPYGFVVSKYKTKIID